MNTHIFVCHMHLLWPVYKISTHTVREQNRNNISRLGRLITKHKQRGKTGILSWDTGQGLGRPSFSSWLGQRPSWASEKLFFHWQAKVPRDETTCQFVYLNSQAFHQRTVWPTHLLWKQVKVFQRHTHTPAACLTREKCKFGNIKMPLKSLLTPSDWRLLTLKCLILQKQNVYPQYFSEPSSSAFCTSKFVLLQIQLKLYFKGGISATALIAKYQQRYQCWSPIKYLLISHNEMLAFLLAFNPSILFFLLKLDKSVRFTLAKEPRSTVGQQTNKLQIVPWSQQGCLGRQEEEVPGCWGEEGLRHQQIYFSRSSGSAGDSIS